MGGTITVGSMPGAEVGVGVAEAQAVRPKATMTTHMTRRGCNHMGEF
jgi:hypothetical protein